jgi:hypothetical protein
MMWPLVRNEGKLSCIRIHPAKACDVAVGRQSYSLSVSQKIKRCIHSQHVWSDTGQYPFQQSDVDLCHKSPVGNDKPRFTGSPRSGSVHKFRAYAHIFSVVNYV